MTFQRNGRLAASCLAGLTLTLLSDVIAQPQWVTLPGSGPQTRYRHGMAYDSIRERVVLAGGSNFQGTNCSAGCPFGFCPCSIGGALTDVWEWDGVQWTQTVPPAPQLLNSPSSSGVPAASLLTFNRSRGTCIVPIGFFIFPFSMWEWNGSQWTQTPVTSPPGAFKPRAATYDELRSVNIFAGDPASAGGPPVLWEWNGSQALQLAVTIPGTAIALTYDSTRGVVVGLYESSSDLGVFEWNGTTLSTFVPALRPAHRQRPAFAFDTFREVCVLHGGSSTSGPLGDVWEWNGSAWTERFPSNPLPPREQHSMVHHVGCDQMLLFGGTVPTIGAPTTCPGSSNPCTPSNFQLFSGLSQYLGGCGSGQANSANARLVINNCFGVGTCGGPFPIRIRTPGTVQLIWIGPPLAPALLFAGPVQATGFPLGCVGSIDIGTAPLLQDLVLLGDGTTDPTFLLDAQGKASQSYVLPGLPPGPLISLQGAVLQPQGAPCPIVATAAFAISTR